MKITNILFKLSESRGKEASGLALRFKDSIYVLKEPITSSKLVKTSKYKQLFNNTLKQAAGNDRQLAAPVLVLGHSRLQTNGQSEINTNNQPVVKDGAIGIHNGIIVNDDKIWASYPALTKKFAVDTEALLSLIQMLRSQGKSIIEATKLAYAQIEGSASIAVTFDDVNILVLATNTGSLYTALSQNEHMLIFASEKFILEQILKDKLLRNQFISRSITHINAGQGFLVDLDLTQKQTFSLKDETSNITESAKVSSSRVTIHELYDQTAPPLPDVSQYLLRDDIKQSMIKNWEALYLTENSIKRCSRCLLPETMPFITFDDDGVCSYCRDYEARGSYLKGEKALEEFVSKYRSSNGECDVLVGFSGGRDSAYGLDYIKNTLHLHPITFTYDWGMVNDLRRFGRDCPSLVRDRPAKSVVKRPRGAPSRRFKVRGGVLLLLCHRPPPLYIDLASVGMGVCWF